jgi:hypothetical protein
MSQDDSPGLAAPSAGKVAPEAVALRAQPRPVTRLNRRTLAILTGGLSVAVLGATIWSLQPHRRGAGEQTELVQRGSCLEVRRAGRVAFGLLQAAAEGAGAGATAAGRSRAGHRGSQQPVTYYATGPRPQRRLAQGGRSGGGFVGVLPLGPQGKVSAPARAQRRLGPAAAWRLRPAGRRAGLDGGPAQPTRLPCRTGKTRKRRS